MGREEGHLDHCEVCKGYLLTPCPAGICGTCALAVTRRRAEVQREGGLVLVCGGEVREFTREELLTSEGLAEYERCSQAATRGHSPITIKGNA